MTKIKGSRTFKTINIIHILIKSTKVTAEITLDKNYLLLTLTRIKKLKVT